MCKQCTANVPAMRPQPFSSRARRRRRVVSARRAAIASRGDRGTAGRTFLVDARARGRARRRRETREGEFDASVIRIGAESRSIDARESAEERRASARERWRDVRAFRASVGETR